mmetsp:Transcript_33813/g.67122  ORF Transcript_33813/g.67122 Transcript_33813/m.67122 type:complete len:212 (+) Transcript_33813:637-1272(+)
MVKFEKPATKVPNSTQPQTKMYRKPAAAPRRHPFVVTKGQSPPKRGTTRAIIKMSAMWTSSVSFMNKPPEVAFTSLAECNAKSIAAMFTTTTMASPRSSAFLSSKFARFVSFATTEAMALWKESAQEAIMHTAKRKTKMRKNFVVPGKSKNSKKVKAGTEIGEPSRGHASFCRMSLAFKSKPDKPKRKVMEEAMPPPTRKPMRNCRSSFAA